MNHFAAPGQITLRLTWANLFYLLRSLHQTVGVEVDLAKVVIWGGDRLLRRELQHLWQLFLRRNSTGKNSKPSTALYRNLSLCTLSPNFKRRVRLSQKRLRSHPFKDLSQASLQRTESSRFTLPAANSSALEMPVSTYKDTEEEIYNAASANLLVLDDVFKIWIEISPAEPSGCLKHNEFQIADVCAIEQIPYWQVTFTIDQAAIDCNLPKPFLLAKNPIKVARQSSHPRQSVALKKFWTYLLQISQSSSVSSTPPEVSTSHFAESQSTSTLLTSLLAQQAPIGMLEVGLDGGISQANPAFCKLTGYSETQLRQLDNHAITHPEDFAAELRLLQQMISEGQTQQLLQKRYRRSDNTFVWTEVKFSLMGDVSAAEGRMLLFVTDLSDRRLAEQEIQQRRERESLLNDISAQIRSTFDLQKILQVAVERLRHALATDRVLAYQFYPDHSGICLAEDVALPYPPMLGLELPPECIPFAYLEAYRRGRLWSAVDVYSAGLTDCYQGMLNQYQVRGMIATAIVSLDEKQGKQNRNLWGLLVVHQCQGPRTWTGDELQLVRAVANQIATALDQTRLLQQLQLYAHELEERVSQRTRSLQRSLQFEQLTRSLTETLRKDLDDDQVLKAAVQGLVNTLQVDGCIASLFNHQTNQLEIRYECFQASVVPPKSLIKQSFPLEHWGEDCRNQILARKTCLSSYASEQAALPAYADPTFERFFEEASANQRTLPTAVSKVMSPITDDQGLIGVLTVFQLQPRQFEPDAVILIQQVANQCAIALRQAHLFRQEHEQRLSAEYFRSFLHKSIDIFAEYDSELRYVSINPAGCAALELSESEIIGKTNRELLDAAADEIEGLIHQASLTGEKIYVDHELALPKGARVFETVYAPITNYAGIVQRVIAVSRDVTEFKYQWQLLETRNHQLAETTRLKEEFVATTSHELRTPLTAILGFSNVLLQEFFGELNPKQKDYIERIHTSGQHLLDLINDILDLSRLEADRLELDLQTIFVPDLCEGVMGLIQERALNQGLEIKLDIASNVEWIVADPRRLKQMLLNLLINAVKFTQAGSVGMNVSCHLQSDSAPVEPTTAVSRAIATIPKGTIYFEVWDTGIGISKEDQSRLFCPFSQIDSSLSRKHQGTGLGLVITRKLAELHGGTVAVESQPEEGARFTISLPIEGA